jgi:hypothetical protein
MAASPASTGTDGSAARVLRLVARALSVLVLAFTLFIFIVETCALPWGRSG